MIETQTNSHILMNELSSSSSAASSLPEGCKGNDMIMSVRKGHIDTAAPFESVKAAVSKFKGLIKWEDDTTVSIEEILRLSSFHGATSSKMMRSESSKKNITNVGQIDTAAPFESVRDAISRFRGAGSRPDSSTLELQRQKSLHTELGKLQEDLLEQRKESEAAEATKGQALAELESIMMLIEDLKRSLEIAHSDAACARRWSKLQAAKERVDAEMSSAKQEIEAMEEMHAEIIRERDGTLMKAKELFSESVAMERAMEILRMQIGSTKESVELARSAYIEAEGKKDAAAAEFDLEKSSWETEMKLAEDELAKLEAALLVMDDLRSQVDSSCASLREVRSQLSSFMEARGARTKELELDLVKPTHQVGKANDEVDSLKATVSSLKSTLEREKSAMDATRKREGSASASVPALEAEIESTEAEIELVRRREKEAREKAEQDLPRALDEAEEEAIQAKSVAKVASEELNKAEEEAELAKAEANTIEKRLDAAVKEIQAAKASVTMANSTATAMKESKHARQASNNGITLPTEEYLELQRNAAEAEEIAKKRVVAAIEEIRGAAESELRVQQDLEAVKRAIEDRKRELAAAGEETERAQAESETAEQELREWKVREEQEKRAIGVTRSLSGPAEMDEVGAGASSDDSPRVPVGCTMTRSNTINTVGYAGKHTKRKGKPLVPLFSMIWGKKKHQPPS